MFKLDLEASEVDQTFAIPSSLRVSCSFTPSIRSESIVEDPYEALIVKESSSLWSEVLKKKEERMNRKDIKESIYYFSL